MRLGILSANLRKYFAKFVAEVGATELFLLLVLVVIVFYPLLFVGFTTKDDADIAINSSSPLGLMEQARIWAELQGRVTYFWAYPLLRMPYVIDSWLWYLAVKSATFFLLLSALYYAVCQIFRSSWIALASLIFFLAFIQNGWDHNALTSFPVAYNTYAVLFLVSLGLFSTAIDRKSMAIASLSGVLYFFALGAELFVLFFPFYVAVLLSRATPSVSVIKRLMSGKKYILAIALALMVYLAIYLFWRNIHPSAYEGNSLNGLFNLRAVVKVIATYSLNAFPFSSLNFMLSPEQQMLFSNSVGVRAILSELNASHFIKPAVAGFLFARLMTTIPFIVPQPRTLLIGAALACVGIFLPNLLLGFNQKYQSWVLNYDSHMYLYTYYSFISAVIFAALVLAFMNTKSRSWHPKLRRALIWMGVIVIMAISFAVEVRNQYIAFDQKLSNRKWQLMDVVIKSPAFMGIPDGSIVVAPTLSSHQRGIAQAHADYWSGYIKYKTGKNVQFVDYKCKSGTPCYSLVFRQEPHSDKQFIVLAKIKDPDTLISSELTIYSLPNQAGATLMGSFVHAKVSPRLEIDGASIANVGAGLFISNSPFASNSDGHVQTARVTGNVDLFPDQMSISYYGIASTVRPLSAELGDGFYGWETGAGQPPYAWSTDTSKLRIVNFDLKAAAIIVKFEITSLEKMELRMLGGTTQSFSITPGVYLPIEIKFVAQPGVTYIDLHSDHQPIQPSSGDPRLLSFAIRKLQLQN